MTIKHFALVHIFNNEYYNKEDDGYTNNLLQTVYEREWNRWIVELINHIASWLDFDEEDCDEETVYNLCSEALEKHLLLFIK